MGVRVFVVSKENLLYESEDLVSWYYINASKDCENFYIGYIVFDLFSYDTKIENKKIKQFNYIISSLESVFDGQKLQELLNEVQILKDLDIVNEKNLAIVKNGSSFALKRRMYLRFVHD